MGDIISSIDDIDLFIVFGIFYYGNDFENKIDEIKERFIQFKSEYMEV